MRKIKNAHSLGAALHELLCVVDVTTFSRIGRGVLTHTAAVLRAMLVAMARPVG